MLSWFSFLCYLSYIRCHLSSPWTKYRILSRIHDRTTDLSGFSPISSYINLPENISAGWLRISTMPLSGGLHVFSHAVLLFSFFTYIPHNYYDIYTYHDLHVYFSMMLTLLVFVFLFICLVFILLSTVM